MFSSTFMRHMHDYGTTPEQVAAVRAAHSEHASNNPKAYYKKRVTVEDVLASRIICKPLHLLDCCVETDNATAIIVTTRRAGARRAPSARADPRRRRAAAASRASTCTTSTGRSRRSPASTRARSCGPTPASGPEDVDVTGSYDAFTFTTMLQLEDYGFCKKGEGGALRQRRHHPARRPAAQQHQRRAPVRGLHARHEHGDRERAPAAPRRRRQLPRRRRTASASTPTTTARAAAAR